MRQISTDLGSIYSSLDLRLNKFEASITTAIEGFRKLQAGAKSASNEMKRDLSTFSGKMEQLGKDFKKIDEKYKYFGIIGDKLEDTGKKLTKGVTLPIIAAGTASTKFAIDFESAFAGVKKTVDATDGQLDKLRKGILDTTKVMPQSAVEISAVAEAAGQLGIKTDNILDFTKTMVMLGDATNLSSEEAATSLARLANITGMSQKDFDKLGSTIVSLGNNLATTERDIVAMGMRLAGAGRQIGLTEAQTLSFAGALSSVGIEAEAGGSAFSKLMIEIQLAVETGNKNLKNFANVAGMTSTQFKKAFKDDATGAIIEFIKGLSESEKKGISAIKVLDDMGITEVRMRDALLRAAGASGVFTESIELGTKAWKENIALTKEAEQRYETSESKLKMMKNQLVEAGIKIGEKLLPTLLKIAENVGKAAEWFSNLNEGTQEAIIKFALVAAATGPVLIGLGKISTGIGSILTLGPKITTFFGLFGTASAAATATGAVGTAATVATGTATGGGILGLGASIGTLAVAAAPWLIAGAAVAGTGYLIYKGLTDDTIPAVDLFADKIEYTSERIGSSNNEMALAYETSATRISEATKQAVGAYTELDNSAKEHMNSLYINSTVISEEIKTETISKFTEMKNKVVAGYEAQKNESIESLKDMFKNALMVTEVEQKQLIESTDKFYSVKTKNTEYYEQRINEIVSNASKEKRAITQSEMQEINALQDSMRSNAVKALSQNEIEAKIILQRMKDYDVSITKEQAVARIAELNKSKDEAVKIAQDEYEKRIALIEQLKAQGVIKTQEQADKMIFEAKRQRDGMVKEAENTRIETIDKMRSLYKDLDKEINTFTGKSLNALEKLDRWWNGWKPETKIFNYGIYGGDGGGGSSGGRLNIAKNFSGTKSFEGGLTTLHEKGYEVYELPQGTRIYNHEASEDMVVKTAEAVAKSVIKGLETNNTEPAIIKTSVILDGREIATATAPYNSNNLAMGIQRRR